MTTMQRLSMGLVLVAVLGLVGCIKVDQTLTLNADGSGTLVMRYGMAEQTIAQIKAMEQMGGQGGQDAAMQQEAPFEFDIEQVRAEFEADKPKGVELTALSSEVVDGWQFIDLAVDFEDIRALKRTKLFEDSKLAIERTADGDYRLTQQGGNDAMAAADSSQQQLMQQMSAMLAGFRIAQTVVVPGDILETNAPLVDGRRASWVFDIAEDPGVLAKLSQTDMELIFAGTGVDLPSLAP